MVPELKEIYQKVPTIVMAAPLLFTIPILAEGAQHIAEFQLGMFNPNDGISAGSETTIRMLFGIVKVLSVLFAVFWIPRFWFNGNSVKAALAIQAREMRFLAWSVIVMLAAVLFVFFLGPILINGIVEAGVNLPQILRPYIPLILLIGLSWPLENLSLWWMGGTIGDISMTKDRSRRLHKKHGKWKPVLALIISVAPAVAFHFFLNNQIVGASFPTQIGLLALDSCVVGLIAVLLGNGTWVIYNWVAEINQIKIS